MELVPSSYSLLSRRSERSMASSPPPPAPAPTPRPGWCSKSRRACWHAAILMLGVSLVSGSVWIAMLYIAFNCTAVVPCVHHAASCRCTYTDARAQVPPVSFAIVSMVLVAAPLLIGVIMYAVVAILGLRRSCTVLLDFATGFSATLRCQADVKQPHAAHESTPVWAILLVTRVLALGLASYVVIRLGADQLALQDSDAHHLYCPSQPPPVCIERLHTSLPLLQLLGGTFAGTIALLFVLRRWECGNRAPGSADADSDLHSLPSFRGVVDSISISRLMSMRSMTSIADSV